MHPNVRKRPEKGFFRIKSEITTSQQNSVDLCIYEQTFLQQSMTQFLPAWVSLRSVSSIQGQAKARGASYGFFRQSDLLSFIHAFLVDYSANPMALTI